MGQIIVDIGGNTRSISFEESYNELLGETNMMVIWNNGEQFIMAYDFEKDRLVIQGAASYEALDCQQEIAKVIEQFNL